MSEKCRGCAREYGHADECIWLDLLEARAEADRLLGENVHMLHVQEQLTAERDRLRAWGADALHAMDKVAPDAPRFEDLQDRWDEMEQTRATPATGRFSFDGTGRSTRRAGRMKSKPRSSPTVGLSEENMQVYR